MDKRTQSEDKKSVLNTILGGIFTLIVSIVPYVLESAEAIEGKLGLLINVVSVLIVIISISLVFQKFQQDDIKSCIKYAFIALVLELLLLLVVHIYFPTGSIPLKETEPCEDIAAEGANITAGTTPTSFESTYAPASPEIHIFDQSFKNGILQLAAKTIPSGYSILWSSGDESIATVSDSGLVQAVSPGTVRIEATFVIEEEAYNDSIMVTIESSTEEIDSGVIYFFEDQPKELTNWPTSGNALLSSYDIHNSKDEALSSVGIQNAAEYDVSSGKIIGYIYYHWCRGEDLKAAESHNRTSGETKGLHYSNLLQQYVECNAFSCFFSTAYLSEEGMEYADDGTGCMWFENYDVCHDSYWYWAIPVYEAQYTLKQTVLNITVPD